VGGRRVGGLGVRRVVWLAAPCRAPPALVIGALLPPGLLERFELLVERTSAPEPEGLAPADRDLLAQLERGARPVRGLVTAEGRVALLRRLRGLEERGLVTIDWTLLG